MRKFCAIVLNYLKQLTLASADPIPLMATDNSCADNSATTSLAMRAILLGNCQRDVGSYEKYEGKEKRSLT